MNQLTEEKIWDILDGNADAALVTEHKTALKSDADYRTTFDQCARLHTNLLAMPMHAPSLRFTENVMDKILPQTKTSLVPDRRPLVFCLLLAIFSLPIVGIFSTMSPSSSAKSLNLTVNTEGFTSAISNPMFTYGVIVLNIILVLIFLDRRVLKPYFEKRYAK